MVGDRVIVVCVALLSLLVFAVLLRQTVQTFSRNLLRSEVDRARGEWQFGRHKVAYLILLPALLSIAVKGDSWVEVVNVAVVFVEPDTELVTVRSGAAIS